MNPVIPRGLSIQMTAAAEELGAQMVGDIVKELITEDPSRLPTGQEFLRRIGVNATVTAAKLHKLASIAEEIAVATAAADLPRAVLLAGDAAAFAASYPRMVMLINNAGDMLRKLDPVFYAEIEPALTAAHLVAALDVVGESPAKAIATLTKLRDEHQAKEGITPGCPVTAALEGAMLIIMGRS